MKLTTYLTLASVVGGLFGLASLLMPDQFLANYTETANITNIAMDLARIMGASLLGLALMNWMMRDAQLSIARRAALAGLALVNLLSMIVVLVSVINGTTNALGWMSVVLYLLFGGGAAYFFYKDHSAIKERELKEKVGA